MAEEKKPGFFSRLFGGKPEAAPTPADPSAGTTAEPALPSFLAPAPLGIPLARTPEPEPEPELELAPEPAVVPPPTAPAPLPAEATEPTPAPVSVTPVAPPARVPRQE